MRGFTAFSFYIFLVVNSGTSLGDLPKEDHHTFEVWNDGNVEKRSESSSSSSFHVKVEEYEQKTDEKGTHEVTKIRERNKPAGGNETSSSKTIEVIRFPNGTIHRRVKNNGPGMKAECFKNEDCSADKFCSKLRFQCQQCVDGFGCFNDDQCCGKKVCKFGNCQVEPERTGLAGSPCDEDSQCNAGLFCLVHVFEGGKCQELRKDGESCTKGILSRDTPKCAEGLQCMKTGIFSQRCLKEGSVEDKTPVDSPFDLFNNNDFFRWKK